VYGKIFVSMYDGTLADYWKALVTFQQMIVLCDDQGIVDMTPSAISRRTGIPQDIIVEGIEILSKPDLHSRTPDEDGKRIVLIDENSAWGWRIVNHKKYRQMASYEDKKRADRERIAEKRNKNNGVANSRNKSQIVADVAHTDTDTDTYNNIPYVEIVSYLNKKTASNFKNTTGGTRKLIKARFAEGFTIDDFKAVIDHKVSQWSDDAKMNVYLRPETLFSGKFDRYLNETRKTSCADQAPKEFDFANQFQDR